MITMKRILTIIALVIVTLPAFAQKQKSIPAGMRMEICEAEQNDNAYSIFTYKDEDGTFGYYLSLGRVYRLLEVTTDNSNMTLDHVNETCLLLGSTADEAAASLDALFEMFDAPVGTVKDYPCRLTTGAESLGDSSVATCMVVKRLLEGKRLNFLFKRGNHTVSADLTKSAIKTLRWNFKLGRKLHPSE